MHDIHRQAEQLLSNIEIARDESESQLLKD